MEKPLVVVSDLHGHVQKLIKVLMHYGNDCKYIFNGDVIDRGPDSKGVLETIRSMGSAAVLLTGNHEWATRAALTDVDEQRRSKWRDEVWLRRGIRGGIEGRMLESYGISNSKSAEYQANALRQKLHDTEHLALLESAQMFYEDEELLVLHAGVDGGKTWEAQRTYLNNLAAQAQNRIFDDEPGQLFDFKFTNTPKPPRDVWQKTLITGHTHLRSGTQDRVWWGNGVQRPSRVRLASHLTAGDPLFVYESDSHKIQPF